MTSLAAAIGRVQLERLPSWTEARRENAARLSAALDDAAAVRPPVEPDGARHAYHQYTVRCADRDALREHLEAAGVASGVYYPTPIHRLGAYDGYDADVPVADRAADEVLSLPVHPNVTGEDVDRIAEAVRSVSRTVAP